MGKLAIIIIISLIFITSYFVITNNSIKETSLSSAIKFHSDNHSKNIADSALQIGIRKITTQEWKIDDKETFYMDNDFQWKKKGQSTKIPIVKWDELSGYYSVSAERNGNEIVLTTIGTPDLNSNYKSESKAYFDIQEGSNSGPNLLDFDGIHVESSIVLTGSSQIFGNLTSNTTANKSINLAWSTKINGNLSFAGDNIDNIIEKPSGQPYGNLVTGTIKPNTVISVPPAPSYPDFPTLPNKGDFKTPWVSGLFYPIYDDGHYNLLEATSSRTITIFVGTETRKIRVNNLNISQGHIILSGTGKLIIYVDNQFTLGGDSSINKDGDNSKVHIYYSGVNAPAIGGNTRVNSSISIKTAPFVIAGSNAIQGHIISGGSEIKITGNAEAISRLIYAPLANVIFEGSGRGKGNIICKSMSLTGDTRFFYNDQWKDDPIPDLDAGVSTPTTIIHKFSI